MSKQLFLIICALGLAGYASGQIAQPGRYEIELKSFDSPYEVLGGEENGLLLYKQLDQYQQGYRKWQFIKLDTGLNEQWKREYFIDNTLIYKGYEYHQDNYYFLYQITRRGSKDLLLIRLSDSKGDTTHHIIRNLVPLQLNIFEVADSAALIGGYYNMDPVVIYYNFYRNKAKVLPGIYGNKTELVQIKIIKGLINVLVTSRTFDNRNTLTLKVYDGSGEYLDNYTFRPKEDLGLIFGRIAEVEDVGTLISGTYGARRSDYSRGIFIARHKPGEGQVIRYFNYADMNNFFSYMKAKRQARVSKRIERKKIQGKKIKFNYRLLVHEIVKNNDTYVMLGEAFYPKYDNTSFASPFVNSAGNPSMPYYGPSTFVGYRYTHAVVIGFDREGNMLWDNSFEIEDVLTYDLEQFVHADVLDDKVVLMYLYNNEVRTKIISGSEVLEGKSYDNVRMMFADDVENKNGVANIGGLEKWYGHYFYAYGIQRIKNLRDAGVKLNRRVFYINKLIYKEGAKDEQKTSQLNNLNQP